MKIWIVWALVGLVAALQVGDWLTTRRVLAQGGREENPVMVRLIALLGLDGALALKGMIVAASAVLLAIYVAPLSALAADVAVCAVYVWVVWHNWRQIK